MFGKNVGRMKAQAAIELPSATARTLSMRGQAAIEWCSRTTAGGMRAQAAIELPSATARTLSMRGQAAMEYLMTYGWALLVIVIVIAILLIINPFSAPQGCRFEQIGFTCTNPAINGTGTLFLSITNGNNNAIRLLNVTCTGDKSAAAPVAGTGTDLATLQRQGAFQLNSTNNIRCTTAAGAQFTGTRGAEFSGKVWLYYRNEEDGADYPVRTVSANIVAKVS